MRKKDDMRHVVIECDGCHKEYRQPFTRPVVATITVGFSYDDKIGIERHACSADCAAQIAKADYEAKHKEAAAAIDRRANQ